MTAVTTLALPLFALIALGYAAGRGGMMTAPHVAALNKFVFYFAMPAAVFHFASQTAPPAEVAPLAIVYLVLALSFLGVGTLIGRSVFGLSPGDAGAHGYAGVFGNAVFIGLPIALAVEGWATPYLVLMLMEGVFVIAAGAALMSRQGASDGPVAASIAAARQALFSNPIVIATIIGFAAAIAGLALPVPVQTFFQTLGGAAGPTALFALGAYIAVSTAEEGWRFGAVAGRLAGITFIKLLLLPGAMFLTLTYIVPVPPDWRAAATLFTAVPTAVGAFVQASHYGVYMRETAAALAVTTPLSLITISALLSWLAPG